MSKINELSAFQKNMNYLTLYLYLMNTRCKHLEYYDDEGDFKSHNYFFSLCRTKLKYKIEDDENLLINNPIFNNYDFNFENDKKSSEKNKLKNIRVIIQKLIKDIDTKKENNEFIYNTYFEYSKTLSNNKFKNRASNYLVWGTIGLVFSFFMFTFLINFLLEFNFLTRIWLCSLFFYLLIFSLYYFVRGKILSFEIKNKNITKTKFAYMYSNDYCYKRIKKCEEFFRNNYNVENEILEINEIERKFPEKQNFFYQTIMETNMKAGMQKKLLEINNNVYCRAVFSELFESIIKDGIEQQQQISFVFKGCKDYAKISIEGNNGFVDCINHLLGKEQFFYENFNSAMQKLTNPKTDIFPKYLAILEKYENILQ